MKVQLTIKIMLTLEPVLVTVKACLFVTFDTNIFIYAFIAMHWVSIPIVNTPWSYAKIQQTKMLVTCQRFGDLFLFGLV